MTEPHFHGVAGVWCYDEHDTFEGLDLPETGQHVCVDYRPRSGALAECTAGHERGSSLPKERS